ncbi:hypothetical protein [Rhizobium phage RHph_X2_30]|nr:hypothetical protein [Rhizobium phage RHph_X2_30]
MSDIIEKLELGDVVLVRGTVERFAHKDSVHVRFPDSNQLPQLKLSEVAKVEQFAITVGSRIRWHEHGHWEYGNVLAINPDPVNKATWLWVQVDGKWPRVTLSLDKVQRA